MQTAGNLSMEDSGGMKDKNMAIVNPGVSEGLAKSLQASIRNHRYNQGVQEARAEQGLVAWPTTEERQQLLYEHGMLRSFAKASQVGAAERANELQRFQQNVAAQGQIEQRLHAETRNLRDKLMVQRNQLAHQRSIQQQFEVEINQGQNEALRLRQQIQHCRHRIAQAHKETGEVNGAMSNAHGSKFNAEAKCQASQERVAALLVELDQIKADASHHHAQAKIALQEAKDQLEADFARERKLFEDRLKKDRDWHTRLEESIGIVGPGERVSSLVAREVKKWVEENERMSLLLQEHAAAAEKLLRAIPSLRPELAASARSTLYSVKMEGSSNGNLVVHLLHAFCKWFADNSALVDGAFSDHASHLGSSADQDQTVSANDLRSDASSAKPRLLDPIFEAKLKRIFDQCDLHHDKKITIREFIIACRKNKDIADFFHLPQQIHQEDGTRDAVEAFFQSVDTNDSRSLTFEELKEFYVNHPNFEQSQNIYMQ